MSRSIIAEPGVCLRGTAANAAISVSPQRADAGVTPTFFLVDGAVEDFLAPFTVGIGHGPFGFGRRAFLAAEVAVVLGDRHLNLQRSLAIGPNLRDNRSSGRRRWSRRRQLGPIDMGVDLELCNGAMLGGADGLVRTLDPAQAFGASTGDVVFAQRDGESGADGPTRGHDGDEEQQGAKFCAALVEIDIDHALFDQWAHFLSRGLKDEKFGVTATNRDFDRWILEKVIQDVPAQLCLHGRRFENGALLDQKPSGGGEATVAAVSVRTHSLAQPERQLQVQVFGGLTGDGAY